MKSPIKPPVSQFCWIDGKLWLSGIIGSAVIENEIQVVHGGLKAEFDQAIALIKPILGSQNLDLSNVRRVMVYLADMSDYDEMNRLYAGYFSEPYPIRTCVQAAKLPYAAAIELEVIATKEKRQAYSK